MSHRRVGSALPIMSPDEAKKIVTQFLILAEEVRPQLDPNDPTDQVRLRSLDKRIPRAEAILEQINQGIVGFTAEAIKELHTLSKLNPLIDNVIIPPPPPRSLETSIAQQLDTIKDVLTTVFDQARRSGDDSFTAKVNAIRLDAESPNNKPDGGIFELLGKMAKCWKDNASADVAARTTLKSLVTAIAKECATDPNLQDIVDQERLKTLTQSLDHKQSAPAEPANPKGALSSLAPKPKY